jgi:glycosyltransferase involved in cell wall biosynthesis
MNKKKYNYGIILPFKESFLKDNSGAVGIYVNEFLKKSKYTDKTVVFVRKANGKYLNNNIFKVESNSKIFTNINYLKEINESKIFKSLDYIEVHNRPSYAEYLLKKNPSIKLSLFLHNEFYTKKNLINNTKKKFLLNNCENIIFVSKFLKDSFFKNLDENDKNNVDIIHNIVTLPKKINKNKKKIIIFSGKLNKSKGFNIFLKSVSKILNKHHDWKAYIVGDEKREKYEYNHKNIINKPWLPHYKLLKLFSECSISVVNPTWNEPFGRTALESSSRGCAVITSKSGGLNETFKNNLVLKRNNEKELFKVLNGLIIDKKKLKFIQKLNFNNQLVDHKIEVNKFDNLKPNNSLNKVYPKLLNILHIGVFGEKQNYRTLYLSLANKISNGFIKNNHNVINFDYRAKSDSNFLFKKLIKNIDIDTQILKISKNYKPNLIIFGHNNMLSRKSIIDLKKKYNTKIALWYEDHITKNDPNSENNLKLIEKNNDLIDQYFITTHKKYIKTKIKYNKINFMPMPVDPSIEKYNFYNYKNKSKDLFYAISHGINRGVLKKNHYDNRVNFINNLIQYNEGLNFNLFGFNNEQPKWNEDLYNEMKKSYFALNLSRGGPYKHTSSNRISTYVGNGMPTFVDKKLGFSDFFSDNELIYYENEKDIINKINDLKTNPKKIYNIGKNGKKKYFKIFNNTIIADYIVSKTLKLKSKYKYIWENK